MSATERPWPAVLAGAALTTIGGPPFAAGGKPAGGLYRVVVVVAMPDVPRPIPFGGVGRGVAADETDGAFLRIVSDPKIAACPPVGRSLDRDRLTLAVARGRVDDGRASARYELGEASYAGRIEVTMAGKNMTMTEVQRAVRLGDCP